VPQTWGDGHDTSHGLMSDEPPDDKTAYVANPQTNDVSVVDIKSLKQVARVPVGFAPSRNTAWLAL
jgi:YVTN family beta-propeller protein